VRFACAGPPDCEGVGPMDTHGRADSTAQQCTKDTKEAIMMPKGLDMGDYEERYQDYDIEVAVEQVLTGVKAHFRVLRNDAVVVDWRLVHIDTLWSTERAAAEAGFRAGREMIDAGFAG
jgi:hypothetical protein